MTGGVVPYQTDCGGGPQGDPIWLQWSQSSSSGNQRQQLPALALSGHRHCSLSSATNTSSVSTNNCLLCDKESLVLCLCVDQERRCFYGNNKPGSHIKKSLTAQFKVMFSFYLSWKRGLWCFCDSLCWGAGLRLTCWRIWRSSWLWRGWRKMRSQKPAWSAPGVPTWAAPPWWRPFSSWLYLS